MRTAIAAILSLLLPLNALAEPPAAPAPPAAAPAEAAPALPDTPAGRTMIDVLRALGADDHALAEDRFAPSFASVVSAEQVAQLFAALRERDGEFRLDEIVEAEEGSMLVRVRTSAQNTLWEISLSLDDQRRINGLFLRPAFSKDVPALRTWDELDDHLAPLPGSVAFGAFRLTPGAEGAPALTPVHVLSPHRQLAIGSAFKLYVLGALAEEVRAGRASWDEPLTIRGELKSLPSGRMQDEPAGAEFPLAHYADLMISISDNTAADHLLHRVGRERVEAYVAAARHSRPELNRPFLSTRDLFVLRLARDRTLPDRYSAAAPEDRRAMLRAPNERSAGPADAGFPGQTVGEIAAASPSPSQLPNWVRPRHIDRIEWFASPTDLANLLADLRRLERIPGLERLGESLRKNSGMPFDRRVWTGVAFKGGSEPGVLNLSWLLTRADGHEYVLTMTWNDPETALDEPLFIALANQAVNLLAAEGAPAPEAPLLAPDQQTRFD